ncbi:MAG: DUF4838 domain-containing protein [bacterium]
MKRSSAPILSSILIGTLVFLCCTDRQPQGSKQSAAIRLLDNGTSDYRIVLEPSVSPSERKAAHELQSYFKACTGVELPIIEGWTAENTPMIVLGCGEAARALGVNPSAEELGEQGCALRTVGQHIIMAGTPVGGTLFGAHRFLEDELGVRWYAPGVTQTPQQTELVIEPMNQLIRPAFLWRHTSYGWPGGDAEFRSRRGDNAGGGGRDNPLGIQYEFDGQAHSYFRYISPDEFFDTHPEYFSEIGGKRIRREMQLCLTNPEVLEIVTERMLKRMEEMPNYRQHNFSQLDYNNGCECANCRAINEKYGTRGGTQFWFVNQLAERTSKVYPDKQVGTLAYMYTEEPPKNLVMHPNVAVWLCHMFPSCDSHPIQTCPLNADYKRRATAWSKICSHLYIWHYVINFAHYYVPFPNFRALAQDMRFYRDIGVEGVYAQAKGSAGGEFSLLRGYYVTELMKNPDQDANDILQDFLDGYYGPAAEPLWRYITLLHDKVENENIHTHLYTNPAQGYLTDDIIAKSEELFDEADTAVQDNAELLERVRVARMPLTYACLFPRNGYEIENSRLIFRQPLASPDEAAAFLARMKANGFDTIREWGGDPDQLLPLSVMLNTPQPLITISNPYLTVDIAPQLGGRALRITDRKTGEYVTAYNTTRNLFFPFCGGEESRVGGYFRHSGTMEPASPVEQSDRHIVLEAQINGNLKMLRTIALDSNRPILRIKLELTNRSDRSEIVRVRSHLSFDLGDLRQTGARFTNLNGETVDKDMTGVIAALREGEHYNDQNCPKNSWTFSGTKGLEVTQRFDNNQIDFTWLYAFPGDLNELEAELWAKEAALSPGENAVLEHELEIRSVAARSAP